MALNYFLDTYRKTSSAERFGLCDDAPPARTPAYIDEIDNTKWIGIVNNDSKIEISFYPVDHCVNIIRPDGTKSQRCDGILKYSNNIHFIELKDRLDNDTKVLPNGKIILSWYDKGIEQLIETIEYFIKHHDQTSFSFNDCYVCNKQVFRKSSMSKIAKFKDRTKLILGGNGLILILSNTIRV